jgi:hypothetical protein
MGSWLRHFICISNENLNVERSSCSPGAIQNSMSRAKKQHFICVNLRPSAVRFHHRVLCVSVVNF